MRPTVQLDLSVNVCQDFEARPCRRKQKYRRMGGKKQNKNRLNFLQQVFWLSNRYGLVLWDSMTATSVLELLWLFKVRGDPQGLIAEKVMYLHYAQAELPRTSTTPSLLWSSAASSAGLIKQTDHPIFKTSWLNWHSLTQIQHRQMLSHHCSPLDLCYCKGALNQHPKQRCASVCQRLQKEARAVRETPLI